MTGTSASGKTTSLRFSPTTATLSSLAAIGRTTASTALGLQVDDVAALARFGNDLAHLCDETMPARRGEQQAAFGARRDHRDDPRLGVDVDHQPQRLAESAPTRQLVGADGVETCRRSSPRDLVGRLRVEGEFSSRRLP
jgi:hypothetical protein